MLTQLTALTRLSVAAGLAATACALAQPPANPLAGPGVEARGLGRSLVEMNIDGTMRRPDVPPAEAALGLIELDDATRASVDDLLAERAAVIDAIVKDNLDTLEAMRSARRAGDREARREHGQTIRGLFEPVLKDGPLEKQIAALLPDETRAAYLDLIREHHRARFQQRRADRQGGMAFDESSDRGRRFGRAFAGEEMLDEPLLFGDEDAPPRRGDGPAASRDQDPGPRADRPRGRRMMDRMSQIQSLGIEIRRSVERVVGDRRDRMDELVETLDLTSGQEARVRALFEKQRGDAEPGQRQSRRQRGRMMQELASILTPEQLDTFREMRGGPDRRGPDRRGPRGQRPAIDD